MVWSRAARNIAAMTPRKVTMRGSRRRDVVGLRRVAITGVPPWWRPRRGAGRGGGAGRAPHPLVGDGNGGERLGPGAGSAEPGDALADRRRVEPAGGVALQLPEREPEERRRGRGLIGCRMCHEGIMWGNLVRSHTMLQDR